MFLPCLQVAEVNHLDDEILSLHSEIVELQRSPYARRQGDKMEQLWVWKYSGLILEYIIMQNSLSCVITEPIWQLKMNYSCIVLCNMRIMLGLMRALFYPVFDLNVINIDYATVFIFIAEKKRPLSSTSSWRWNAKVRRDALIWCEQKSDEYIYGLEFCLHQCLKQIRALTALRWWRPSFRLSRTRTRSSKTCTHTSGRTRTWL